MPLEESKMTRYGEGEERGQYLGPGFYFLYTVHHKNGGKKGGTVFGGTRYSGDFTIAI